MNVPTVRRWPAPVGGAADLCMGHFPAASGVLAVGPCGELSARMWRLRGDRSWRLQVLGPITHAWLEYLFRERLINFQ